MGKGESKVSGAPSLDPAKEGDSSLSSNKHSASANPGSAKGTSTKNIGSDPGALVEANSTGTGSTSEKLAATSDSTAESDDSKGPVIKPNTRGRNGITKMTSRVSSRNHLILPLTLICLALLL